VSIRDQLSTPVTIHAMLVRNKLVDLLQIRNEPRLARTYFLSEISTWMIIMIPASVLLACASPWIVPFLYGAPFRVAGWATGILVLSLAAVAISNFSWCVTLSGSRPGVFTLLTIVTTIAAIAASAVGAALYGVNGAAAGGVIVAAFSAAVWLRDAMSYFRHRIVQKSD
jgi:O-antigen/teichoic acid export membrane protein